jgi:hypothetical protein
VASVAHDAAVAVPAARERRVAKPRPRRAQRAGLFGGVVWIVGLAVLLGGIVAVNVALLQLNVQLDRAHQRKAEVRAANVALEGRLSSAGSVPQVIAAAQKRLGLVPAAPDETTYVDLGARHRK